MSGILLDPWKIGSDEGDINILSSEEFVAI